MGMTRGRATGADPAWVFGTALAALLLGLGCPVADDDAGSDDDVADDDAADDDGADDDVADDDGADDDGADDDGGDDDTEDCPPGFVCVDSFPFTETNDTAAHGSYGFDAYSCDPGIDESGPEIVYQVTLPQDGFLAVAVDDDTPGVDIDVHILTDLDPDSCVDRGHYHAGGDMAGGVAYVVADSWVDGGGVEMSGAYTIHIGHVVPAVGSCEMEVGWLERVGDGGNHLAMPATGPVVLEAHLVTDVEFPGTWPATITDGIPEHHEMSQVDTGFVMHRDQPWCPQEGCEFGQGSYSKPPVEDEAWYICMYWAERPPAGTRMIVMVPDGRAVVASAGYETGPGDLGNVAGTVEEVHFYLGTGHQSELTVGFAVDQSLPLGPIVCQ